VKDLRGVMASERSHAGASEASEIRSPATSQRMLRSGAYLLGAVVVAIAFAGCSLFPTVLPKVQQQCATCSPLPDGYHIEEYISGLDHPIALAWLADGRLLVTEQGGSIRIVEDGKLKTESWATISHVRALNQIGLMGIATAAGAGADPLVFVYYEELPRNAQDLPHQVLLRIEEAGDGSLSETRLFDDITGAALEVNMGGMLHIGPDGDLYVGVGDAGLQAAATEKINIPFGKILRLNKDGAAAGNPFVSEGAADKRIFALGFEGAWDFAFNKETGTLYTVGGITNDVVQVRALAGTASAVPTSSAAPNGTRDPNSAKFAPIYELSAPNDGGDFGRGIELYTGQQLAEFDGQLFACLGSSGLWRLHLDADGLRVIDDQRLAPQCSGDVAEGPDGFLYFVDSLRDRVDRIGN
jgi:glucose/arabinose dehydrogenase